MTTTISMEVSREEEEERKWNVGKGGQGREEERKVDIVKEE